MNTITVKLIEHDMHYANALTAALASEMRNLRVLIAGEESEVQDADVTLTLIEPLRYSGAETIAAEIRRLTSDPVDAPLAKLVTTDTEIYLFAGIEGGAGTSSLAIGTARELSRYRGKKCLYISLEYAESELFGVGKNCGDSMDDLLYEFISAKQKRKNEDKNLFGKIKAHLQHDEYGVMRFPSSRSINRFSELSDSEKTELLMLSIAAAEADCLILDCGSALLQCGLPFPPAANVIVSRHAGIKTMGDPARAYEFARAFVTGTERCIVAINRCEYADDVLSDNDDDENSSYFSVRIDEDPGSFEITDGMIDILLTGAFGTSIKEIVDHLLCERRDEPDKIDIFNEEDFDDLPV